MSLVPGRANDYAGKRSYSSYYSGTDIRIYFGGLWIDEIVNIEFAVQEQVAPIFGYASYTWDKVARGNRFVQGSFSINFKEVGYLQTVLNSLSSKQANNDTWHDLDRYNKRRSGTVRTGDARYERTVENIVDNFHSLADDYEKALWGESSDQKSTLDKRKHNTFFYNTDANNNNQSMRDNGFNILITYGNTEDTSRGSSSRQTAQTIVGVQLGSMSTQIDPSGTPVQEVYNFIAKDISGDVTRPY